MNLFRSIIDEIKSIYTFHLFLLVLAVAVHSFFIEARNLRMRRLSNEERFARVIGIMYFTLGVALYLVSRYA